MKLKRDKDLLLMQIAVQAYGLTLGLLDQLRAKDALTQADEVAVIEGALRKMELLNKAVLHPVLAAATLSLTGELREKRAKLALN